MNRGLYPSAGEMMDYRSLIPTIFYKNRNVTGHKSG